MSEVNVLNMEMESADIVSKSNAAKILKNFNFESISAILSQHYPSDYTFNYDMWNYDDIEY